MKFHRIAGLALALLPCAALGGVLFAHQAQQQQQQKGQAQQQQNQGQKGMHHDRIETLTKVLSLNAQQKDQVQKICTDFNEKTRPLIHQMWTQCQQEHEALVQLLTPEQRNKVPEVLKTEAGKTLDQIGAKLGLSNDQKLKIKEICDKYQTQFVELAKQNNENSMQRMHELCEEVFATVRPILNDEQRAKIPGALREEFQMWHDAHAQSEHLKAIADNLGLNDNQRQQAQKVIADFQPRNQKLHEQLQQICQDEFRAVEQVLNDQQKTKFREIMKVHSK